MRLQLLAGALALTGTSQALSDTSPWALIHTAPQGSKSGPDTPHWETNNHFESSSDVLKNSKEILSKCLTERYLLVTQPGARASDLQGKENCKLPQMCSAARDARIKNSYTVAEVIGSVADANLGDFIKTACAKDGKEVVVEELLLGSLPDSGRDVALSENDRVLAQSLESTTAAESYTILFMSSPNEPTYESEFDEAVRIELKRQVDTGSYQRRANSSSGTQQSLFDKYQFFTPGIFMGIIVAIVLFSILGVGVSALSSLEVSYGAFEKDMGPSQQRKQQ